MLQSIGFMAGIWVLFENPLYFMVWLLIPVLSFVLVLTNITPFPGLFFLIVSSVVYIDLCVYKTLFKGRDPLLLSGVDLRCIKGFLLASLIIQISAVTVYLFVFLTGSIDPFGMSFFLGFVFIACQKGFKFLAFSKYAYEFFGQNPDSQKPTISSFGRDLAVIINRKLKSNT